ncbi:MAG: hypothetical protein ACP5MK_00065 [Candidatus Micrarchaeia archaeon]
MPSIYPFGTYGFGLSIDIIGIMMGISGIILGFGYAFDDKKLKEFGKSELYQSMINVVLVVFLLSLFMPGGIVTGVINTLVGKSPATFGCPEYMSGNSAICLAYSYLAGPGGYTFNGIAYQSLFSIIMEVFLAVTALIVILGGISSLSLSFLFAKINFAPMVTPFLHEMQYMLDIVTSMAISVLVQASILSFVAIAAVAVILPTGIVLRAFYPSRKLGGFLIASAIGFYVVLPLSYLFNIYMLYSYTSGLNETSMQATVASASSAENLLLNTTNASSSVVHLVSSTNSLLSSISYLLDSLFSFVANFIVKTFILPIFSLILTGISIRELAAMLGSEAFFGKFKIL